MKLINIIFFSIFYCLPSFADENTYTLYMSAHISIVSDDNNGKKDAQDIDSEYNSDFSKEAPVLFTADILNKGWLCKRQAASNNGDRVALGFYCTNGLKLFFFSKSYLSNNVESTESYSSFVEQFDNGTIQVMMRTSISRHPLGLTGEVAVPVVYAKQSKSKIKI